MMLNLIMLIAMWPMMMICGYVIYNSAKPKGGMVYGSKLSPAYLQEEEVKQIQTDFEKEIKRNLFLGGSMPFICFFIPYASIQISIWTIWVFVLIVLLDLPYIKANKRIKELKQKRGWYREEKQEEYVEIKAAGEVRRVKIKTFLFPMLLSCFIVFCVYWFPFLKKEWLVDSDYIQNFSIVIFIFASINGILFGMALWMDRQKTEVISSDSDVNVNYTRAKKNVWKDFWLACVWITTGFTFACAVSLIFEWNFPMVVLVGSVLYTLLLLALIFPMMKKFQKIEISYANKCDRVDDLDDDKRWIWGMIYYNPSDRHTMVSQRVGVGTTVNLATPVGKGMGIFTVLVMLSVPILLGWVIFEEFTPISLSISNHQIQAEHLKIEYELSLDEVETVSLITELPHATKSVGSAMEHLMKGTFYVAEEGNCLFLLDPQNTVFIKLTTEERIYYLSGKTDEETKNVYLYLQ